MSDRQKVPNLTLRRVREAERRETRAEFADALARKAAELGEAVSPSERYVARLEDGDIRRPHPAYRRVLTALCRRPITELGFTSPGTGLEHAGSAPAQMIAAVPGSPLLTAGSRLYVQEIEALRGIIDERIGTGAMTATGIDDWERAALRHGRATRYEDPATLLADITSDLAELSRLLGRPAPASVTRRLTRVTAQMAGLVCLMLVKLNERSAWRNWARTARIAAEEAGDPLTLSWVRAHEAYGYYYSEDMHEAISIARHAQHITQKTPSVGAALAAALEARALAALGPDLTEPAQAAIRRAETIMFGLKPADLIASAFGYNEAQLRFHEGSTYTNLRNTPAAWKAQQRALELVPANDYTDRTLTHLDRAACLANDGDITAAANYATSALGLVPESQCKGIILARARDTIRTIPVTHRALPAVRELSDLLHTDNGTDD
jgi:tetratricopeptide (TPR) repeat protein